MGIACKKCGLMKDEDEFCISWKSKQPKVRTRPASRNYRMTWCRACKKLYDKERVRVLQQDPEWVKAERSRKLGIYMRNGGRGWANRQATRARRYGINGYVSWEEWQVLLKSHNNKCHWCKCDLHPSFLTLDHIVPLSKGGEHSNENVVPACMNCNNSRRWHEQTKYPELYGMTAEAPGFQGIHPWTLNGR